MRQLVATLAVFSLFSVFMVPLLDARARAKSWVESNGINWLVLNYNGRTEKFLDWTDEANYFWENGRTYAEEISQQSQEVGTTLEAHRKAILQLQATVRRQDDTIRDLIQLLGDSGNAVSQASALQVWTDVEGNSFVGSFEGYELGSVSIKKFGDGRIYDIPKVRLSPICQELALALDSLN